jgi:anthranilate/para-aminobenzoate synthase component I
MSQYTQLISVVLNLVFGGGFLVSFLTLRSQKKKAGAEAKGAEATAKSTELDNVEEAIKIWRETAESLKVQRDDALTAFNEISKQVESLQKDVRKLTSTNQKILKLIAIISHENYADVAKKIQDEIEKG